VEPARIVGDAVIAAFFAADKAKAREMDRAKVESWIGGHLQPRWDLLETKAKAFRTEKGWRPFHWEIEFPEVFGRDNGGFDAIIGNPPFLGVTSLGTSESQSYTDFLREANRGAGGKCDLVAFFFRRAFTLIRDKACIGLVASKTVAQGHTRNSGLGYIAQNGGTIVRATKRLKWPGPANVVVAVVHIVKGTKEPGKCWLDEKSVGAINSFLVEGHEIDVSPLTENASRAFVGAVVRGAGFIIDQSEDIFDGKTIKDFLLENPDYVQIIKPFWGGENLNNSIDMRPNRWVVDFAELTLLQAQDWPIALKRLEDTVRNQRSISTAKSSDEVSFQEWWRFGRRAKALHSVLEKRPFCLARSEVSWHHMIARVPTGPIFQNTLVVFDEVSFGGFAVLQSRVHEIWAYMFGSSMKNDPRYVPRACCLNFPFPKNYVKVEELDFTGQAYEQFRSDYMAKAVEGLTKTYNRFHKADERSELIQRLRELHDEMDRAVLRAYGWDDLADELRPEFLTEEAEDDHTYQGRYFWNDEGRDRVLSRLLALNAERHAEEVRMGIAPKGSARIDEDEDDSQGGVL
jgi:hypothetical protein